MITTEVTSEQIENWKKIYSENKNNLVVNRISGKELNDYFVEKYHPTKEAPSQFVDTVILNAKENGKQEPIISAYILAGNIYVGIDLNTGFFQVECEDINKMKKFLIFACFWSWLRAKKIIRWKQSVLVYRKKMKKYQ